MQKLYWRCTKVVTCAAALSALGCSDTLAPNAGQDIVIDTTVRYQRLDGFGASAAWYQSWLTEHERKDDLYELLFAELGLDILRFRNRYQRTDEGSELDVEVEIVTRATESLGRRPTILLSSWSPPASMKANNDDDCAQADRDADCTLRKVDGAFPYDDFAGYWADSLAYYADAGIAPDFVSIQNEPSYKPSGWEGCVFEPTETPDLPGYDQALAAVAERIAELPFPPTLIGPETQGIQGGRVGDYMAPLDRSHLGAVAHHLYSKGGNTWDWDDPGPDSYIRPMRSVASVARDLPVWQTEFGTDDDEFIRGGFETAWIIQNSLLEANGSAFLYWELIWPDKGLIALDRDKSNPEYIIRDQYYAVRHFARYTDPGYMRVDVASSELEVVPSAFLSPDEDQLTVVLLNVGESREFVTLDLADFAELPIRGFRTEFVPGDSKVWTELDDVDPTEGVSLPSWSAVTLVAG